MVVIDELLHMRSESFKTKSEDHRRVLKIARWNIITHVRELGLRRQKERLAGKLVRNDICKFGEL